MNFRLEWETEEQGRTYAGVQHRTLLLPSVCSPLVLGRILSEASWLQETVFLSFPLFAQIQHKCEPLEGTSCFSWFWTGARVQTHLQRVDSVSGRIINSEVDVSGGEWSVSRVHSLIASLRAALWLLDKAGCSYKIHSHKGLRSRRFQVKRAGTLRKNQHKWTGYQLNKCNHGRVSLGSWTDLRNRLHSGRCATCCGQTRGRTTAQKRPRNTSATTACEAAPTSTGTAFRRWKCFHIKKKKGSGCRGKKAPSVNLSWLKLLQTMAYLWISVQRPNPLSDRTWK